MCIKRNEVASVRGHRTINLSVPVVGIGLWASCEPLRRHMLNILRPYIPPGCMAVWNSSKMSRHSSLGDHYLSCTYLPFFVFHFKNHTTYFHSENFDFITIFLKKNIVLFSMLPSCRVIFPHSPRNIVMSIVPFEFVMFYLQQKNNLFTIIIIIY